jgi:periplasmic protein TorT
MCLIQKMGIILKRTQKLASHLLLIACAIHSSQSYAEYKWFPYPVDIWTPAFSDSATVSEGLYEPLSHATKRWKICISIPHLKDAFWNAANYAFFKEAQRLGISFTLYEAGGYDNMQTQIRQIRECISEGSDGLILSAIDYDGFNDLIDEVRKKNIPVVDLINGVSSKNISARAVRPYYDTSYQTGQFLLQLLIDEDWGERPARVAWLPGPLGSGWAHSADEGFKKAIEGSFVEIISTQFGDTGRTHQAELIERTLDTHSDIDFIVGTAVAAEAAIRIISEKNINEQTRVISYYLSPGVYRGIQRGVILGAASDNQTIQARIAMDQIVRILEGVPLLQHVAAKTDFLNRANIHLFDPYRALTPMGFNPIFVVK